MKLRKTKTMSHEYNLHEKHKTNQNEWKSKWQSLQSLKTKHTENSIANYKTHVEIQTIFWEYRKLWKSNGI